MVPLRLWGHRLLFHLMICEESFTEEKTHLYSQSVTFLINKSTWNQFIWTFNHNPWKLNYPHHQNCLFWLNWASDRFKLWLMLCNSTMTVSDDKPRLIFPSFSSFFRWWTRFTLAAWCRYSGVSLKRSSEKKLSFLDQDTNKQHLTLTCRQVVWFLSGCMFSVTFTDI